jgi:hypothetical protein
MPTDDQEPLAEIAVGELGNIDVREVAIRFVFGAAASLLAGCTTLIFGPRVGGLFLAFPAILAASLTLIEKKEGNRAAVHDIKGAVLGAVGLAAFALAFEAALRTTVLGFALALAFGTWIATSVGLYLTTELIRRATSRRR